MCPQQSSRTHLPSVFETRFESQDAEPTFFRLTGFIDGVQVAKAHGDFHANGVFRLINIEVYDKPSRSKGYGTQMIQQLMSEANKRECHEFVFIGVDDKNINAGRLYSRMGASPRKIPYCNKRHDYVYAMPNYGYGMWI